MHKKPRKLRRKEREWIEQHVILQIAERVIKAIEKWCLYGEQTDTRERVGIVRGKEDKEVCE